MTCASFSLFFELVRSSYISTAAVTNILQCRLFRPPHLHRTDDQRLHVDPGPLHSEFHLSRVFNPLTKARQHTPSPPQKLASKKSTIAAPQLTTSPFLYPSNNLQAGAAVVDGARAWPDLDLVVVVCRLDDVGDVVEEVDGGGGVLPRWANFSGVMVGQPPGGR